MHTFTTDEEVTRTVKIQSCYRKGILPFVTYLRYSYTGTLDFYRCSGAEYDSVQGLPKLRSFIA